MAIQINNFNQLKKDDQDGANALTTHLFNRSQVTLDLNYHLNPKMHFLLSSSTTSTEQAKQIHKAHISSALSAMGYNKTWSCEL